MNTYADKTKEGKNQSVTNDTSHKQKSRGSDFVFNNSPQAIAQRKLQHMANNSPGAMQLKAFQEMADSSSKAKQPVQLQAKANTPVIQRAPFDAEGNDLGASPSAPPRTFSPAPGGLQGSGLIQAGGGFLTAAANILGFPTQNLLPLAQRLGPLPPGRQALQDVAEPYRTNNGSRAAEMAEMITGQNGAQSLFRQPVGPRAVNAFRTQLAEMQEVSDQPRSVQYDVERRGHLNLIPAFGQDFMANPRSGLWSGMPLHAMGAGYASVMQVGHSIRENPERAAQSFLNAQRADDTNHPGGLL